MARDRLAIGLLISCISVGAQERPFTTVLPELLYSRHCHSEIQLRNLSSRYVDVEIVGHRSSGALVPLAERTSNRFRLAPAGNQAVRLDLEERVDDAAWAQIVEFVPSPQLQPAISIQGRSECADGNELITEPREIAAVSRDPGFRLPPGAGEPIAGEVMLVVNAADRMMRLSACYSAGHTVSDGKGGMMPLCNESVERSLAPYQTWRLDTSVGGHPMIQFHAYGPAVAVQLLRPSALNVRLFKVESNIRFGDPIP